MATKLIPIKDRILRSTVSNPATVSQPYVRPVKYKKSYTSSHLELACEAVRKGMSIRQAAEEYQIPKSTIQDHVTGKVTIGGTSGQKYLSDEEEKDFAKFLLESAKIGYPRTRKEVLLLVQMALSEKGKNVVVSSGWWEGFKKRNPNYSLRVAEQIAHVRVSSCTPETLDKYLDTLQQTLEDNDLLSSPAQIFNCDETGLPLDPKPPKVIVPVGTKHPRTITTGNKSQITVLACCSAAGYVLPPFVVYDRKCLKPEMYDGEVSGTMYGLSDSGWITSELFNLWFLHHFLPHAPAARPLLLLLDGHSSHYNPSVIKKAAEERVIIFCLPPHSSHETQPLDKGPFAPLKSAWKEVCQKFLQENPGKVVSRFTFSKLFNDAWTQSMGMRNVQAGFRCTGIYPFNRDIFKPKEDEIDDSLAKRTGLKFIPLYSPALSKTKCSFTDEEEAKFERRFKEGYDIDTDERYNMWKRIRHPSSNTCHTVPYSSSHSVDTDSQSIDGSSMDTSPDSSPEPPEHGSPEHVSVPNLKESKWREESVKLQRQGMVLLRTILEICGVVASKIIILC